MRPGRHQPFIQSALIDMSIPMAMAAVFRKSILAGADYPSRIGGSYDLWLTYLAARDGQACYYVPQRLTRYRVHPNSGTIQRGVRNLHDTIYVRRKILASSDFPAYRSSLRNGLGVFCGKAALYYLGRRSFWRGRILFWKALSLLNRPDNIVALLVNAVRVLCRKKSP